MSIEWIYDWINRFLQDHSELFVGDVMLEGDVGCYISKPAHDLPKKLYAFFQPYSLSKREPLCRIEVEYCLDALDQATYRVQPMGWS